MSAKNIYEIMKVSKQASKIIEDSTADVDGGNNTNTILLVLGGMLVLAIVLNFKKINFLKTNSF